MRNAFGSILIALLLLFACTVDEDLRINADGSGTYRARLSVPKSLAGDFGDLRRQAEKEGSEVVEEGQNDQERFLVPRSGGSVRRSPRRD